MGIFTSLITLPLAPVRGTAWLAEKLAEEAERQLYDESRLRRELMQLELDHEDGVIDDAQYEAEVDTLLEAITQAREQASAGQARGEGT
jgi:hypothetical protein